MGGGDRGHFVQDTEVTGAKKEVKEGKEEKEEKEKEEKRLV